ncbi:hypothetical protein ACNSPG_11600 [Brucella pituitosa]|uniref:hypothetical protein n=1 Tax=Brucella pituitosa TaxID=571256 RepID=UPI003C7877BF
MTVSIQAAAEGMTVHKPVPTGRGGYVVPALVSLEEVLRRYDKCPENQRTMSREDVRASYQQNKYL